MITEEQKRKHHIADETLIVDEISIDKVSCRRNVFRQNTVDKKLSTKCCRPNHLSTKCLSTKCLSTKCCRRNAVDVMSVVKLSCRQRICNSTNAQIRFFHSAQLYSSCVCHKRWRRKKTSLYTQEIYWPAITNTQLTQITILTTKIPIIPRRIS